MWLILVLFIFVAHTLFSGTQALPLSLAFLVTPPLVFYCIFCICHIQHCKKFRPSLVWPFSQSSLFNRNLEPEILCRKAFPRGVTQIDNFESGKPRRRFFFSPKASTTHIYTHIHPPIVHICHTHIYALLGGKLLMLINNLK